MGKGLCAKRGSHRDAIMHVVIQSALAPLIDVCDLLLEHRMNVGVIQRPSPECRPHEIPDAQRRSC